MRKIFLSFLGANPYKECNYSFGQEKQYTGIRFVQEACVLQLAADWADTDEIVVFTTATAEKNNWLDNGANEGLKTRLLSTGTKAKLCNLSIPDAKNDEDVWAVFDAVFKKLNKGDRVYFDITYGYRFFPMLVVVLLNYAKFLKDIQVEKILYGNFEARDEHGLAPIHDLLLFWELQAWTDAANNFLKGGNSNLLSQLLRQKQSEITDYTKIEAFTKALDNFTASFNTCRGNSIFNSKIFRELLKASKAIKTEPLFSPFAPIFQEIEKAVQQFDDQANIRNGLQAVDWCIKNKLTQQGITLLQETIKAFIAKQHGLKHLNHKDTELVGAAFHFHLNPQDSFRADQEAFKDVINEMKGSEIVAKLAHTYNELRLLRNDINHAGLDLKAKKGGAFHLLLEKYFTEVSTILLAVSS